MLTSFKRLGRLAQLYFPDKKVIATDESLRLIANDGRFIEIFRDPNGGYGDQALSLFDVQMFATDNEVVKQTKGQLLGEDELQKLLQSHEAHQFALYWRNDGQLSPEPDSPNAKAIAVIKVLNKDNQSDGQVLQDYVTKLNVFINNDWWGWRNDSETVYGYESFDAALLDAQY